jgi:hypothetical protein
LFSFCWTTWAGIYFWLLIGNFGVSKIFDYFCFFEGSIIQLQVAFAATQISSQRQVSMEYGIIGGDLTISLSLFLSLLDEDFLYIC